MNRIKTNLDQIDFSTLYKEQKEASTFKIKEKEDWDDRADHFQSKVFNSPYNDILINKMDFSGCKSAIDFGCGVGNISIRLAKNLQSISAVDYSKKMLEYTKQNALSNELDHINTLDLSWEEEWDSLESSDLFIASRSFSAVDLKETIKKINSVTNVRAYITIGTGGSYVADEILDAMNRDVIGKPDFIYIVNTLYQMGFFPKVDYIDGFTKKSSFNSSGEFIEQVRWSLGTLSAEDEASLEKYFYTLKSDDEGKKVYKEKTKWALVSWETKQG